MPETLPKPYVYLFRKGGRRAGSGLQFRIIAWRDGSATITPKATGVPREIPVLRVYIQRLDKLTPVRYYDISSRQVQAQLFGYLVTGAYVGRSFTIQAHGFKPSKQFAVQSTPAEAA